MTGRSVILLLILANSLWPLCWHVEAIKDFTPTTKTGGKLTYKERKASMRAIRMDTPGCDVCGEWGCRCLLHPRLAASETDDAQIRLTIEIPSPGVVPEETLLPCGSPALESPVGVWGVRFGGLIHT